MSDVSCLKLYAHALTLAGWATAAWVFQLHGTPVVIVVLCSTLALASFVAERERARRRREPH